MSHESHHEDEPNEEDLWNMFPKLSGIERIRCLIDLAARRRDADDSDTCLTLLEEAAESARAGGFDRELGEILTDLGVVFGDKGDWEQALKLHDEAEKLLEIFGDDYQNALLFMAQAHAFNHLNNTAEYIFNLYRAIDRFQRLDDHASVGDTYDSVASAHWRQGMPADAYELRLRARDFMRGSMPIWKLCGIEIDLVFDALHNQNVLAALEHAQEAINLAKSCSCDKCLPHAERAYGMALSESGETARALEYLNRACDAFKKLGATAFQAHTLVALARAQKTTNPDEALKLLSQARSIYTAMDSKYFIMRSHMYFGEIHLANEQWQSAIDCFNEAVGYFTERGWIPYQNECLSALSKAYLAIKMPEQALSCIAQMSDGERVNTSTRIDRFVVEVSALEADGKTTKATEMCEKLLSDIEPGSHPEAEATCHLILGKAYSESDPVRANRELLRAAAMFNSIGRIDRANELMNICITEPDRKVHQIQKLEQDRNQYEELFVSDPIEETEMKSRNLVTDQEHRTQQRQHPDIA